MILKEGALLQGGKYRIEKCIGQGGFGITYLAIQAGLEREVAVKEFFLKKHCNRDEDTQQVHTAPTAGDVVLRYRRKFIKEAQTIAALNHPNVVKIIDVFEENETAYYVMERLAPGELSTLIPSGGLSEDVALKYIRQIGAALSYVHEKKILHLDVKPSNVMFRSTGEAVLIDFGVSKRYDTAGGQTSSTPTGVSIGYAPIEQLRQELKSFTPATDVYALAATLYKLVTGNTPPDTSLIAEEGDAWLPTNVSEILRNAIKAGMAIRRKDRPQSVEEFLELLESKPEETMLMDDMNPMANQPIPEESDETSLGEGMRQAQRKKQSAYRKPVQPQLRPKPAKSGGNKTLLITIIVFLIFMAVGAVVVLMSGKGGNQAEAGKSDSSSVTSSTAASSSNTSSSSNELKYRYSKSYPMVFVESNVADFYIGKYEVSQKFWEEVMGELPEAYKHSMDHRGANYPVMGCTSDEVQKFIRKLNGKTGKSFALPTEKQWEYAARGGKKNDDYPYSGTEDPKKIVCAADSPVYFNNGDGYAKNALGLLHMSGNAAELCCGDLVKGGYFEDDSDECEIGSSRIVHDGDGKRGYVGVRLVVLQ